MSERLTLEEAKRQLHRAIQGIPSGHFGIVEEAAKIFSRVTPHRETEIASDLAFEECYFCQARPDTVPLCAVCQRNRDVISRLKNPANWLVVGPCQTPEEATDLIPAGAECGSTSEALLLSEERHRAALAVALNTCHDAPWTTLVKLAGETRKELDAFRDLHADAMLMVEERTRERDEARRTCERQLNEITFLKTEVERTTAEVCSVENQLSEAKARLADIREKHWSLARKYEPHRFTTGEMTVNE